MLTLQEIFDISANHLLKQYEKSFFILDGEEECLYRGPNGLMCAAGPFVKDNVVEHKNFTALVEDYPQVIVDNFPVHDRDALRLVSDLQRLHDNCHPLGWKAGLQELAEKSNLDFKF